jgi:hypothetical protein
VKYHQGKYFKSKIPSLHENLYWVFPQYASVPLPVSEGFKIHLSASILNFQEIFNLVERYLSQKLIHFKFAGTKEFLDQLNTGLLGNTQIGKFMTIYPASNQEALIIAKNLHALTKGFESPVIPSDYPYLKSSIVYYRYGKFFQKKNQPKDERDPLLPVPLGVINIFAKNLNQPSKQNQLFLKRYVMIKALRVRGRGGVYLAFDFIKKENVIIKEGRFCGEVDENKMSAIDRIDHERQILKKLQGTELTVKLKRTHRHKKNLYLVMEYFEGISLNEYLENSSSSRKSKNLHTCLLKDLWEKILKIHSLGINLGDLSPDNVLLGENGIKLIDFEHSIDHQSTKPRSAEVGTKGFHFMEWPSARLPSSDQEYYLQKDIFSFLSIATLITHSAKRKQYLKMRKDRDGKIQLYTRNEMANLLTQTRHLANGLKR